MRHALLPRTLLSGLIGPVAVAAATGGTVLAAAGPAAATPGSAPACTVTWTGAGSDSLWTTAKNWSTGQVPGPASDVCMSAFAFVTATGPVRIHSLQVGEEMTVIFSGTASHPSQVRIATTLGNLGNVELDSSSLTAARVTNGNGLEGHGTSVLTTPALQNSGIVDALQGNLKLTDALA